MVKCVLPPGTDLDLRGSGGETRGRLQQPGVETQRGNQLAKPASPNSSCPQRADQSHRMAQPAGVRAEIEGRSAQPPGVFE